jgi:hypothetical protein
MEMVMLTLISVGDVYVYISVGSGTCLRMVTSDTPIVRYSFADYVRSDMQLEAFVAYYESSARPPRINDRLAKRYLREFAKRMENINVYLPRPSWRYRIGFPWFPHTTKWFR